MPSVSSIGPFATPTQIVTFLDKYSRWLPDQSRRETWPETCRRVMDFFQAAVPSARQVYGDYIWSELERAMLRLDVLPSMRVVQMAGPAALREPLAIFNCAARCVDSWQAFAEILYALMQGCGCSFSVESQYVNQLTKPVKKDLHDSILNLVIEDSTEGWCESFKRALEEWAAGGRVMVDYSKIRPAGTPLKTKGGIASGPGPLQDLFDFAEQTIRRAANEDRQITTFEAHQLCCKIGWIVQVGGVRRAAMLGHSDISDMAIRDAKTGNAWFESMPFLSMSNNSAVYVGKRDDAVLDSEWAALRASGTGERGLINREGIWKHLPERRRAAANYEQVNYVLNPCGEAVLSPDGGLCNLSIAVARPDETPESLKRKIRLAALFGTLQSACTNFHFPFPAPWWQKNAERERLLGVDITGQMDCALLQPRAIGREQLLTELKNVVVATNRWAARQLNINESVAATLIKPSGNSGQLLNVSRGIHPRYAKYYVRRMRFGTQTPMAKFLKASGVPLYPDNGYDRLESALTVVAEFPVAAPAGAITRHDVTIYDQLDNWLTWKHCYAEHSVSCTVYVGADEWDAVREWVGHHWDDVVGLSFLPKNDDHVYPLAPYSEITKSEYDELELAFPVLDFTKLAIFESGLDTMTREFSCSAGVCEL